MREDIEGFHTVNSEPTEEHVHAFCWELNNNFEICIHFQIWSRLTHWVSLFNARMVVACLKGIVNAISHCHWHALISNFVIAEVEVFADFVVTVKLRWMLIVYQWLHRFCSIVIVNHSESSRNQNGMTQIRHGTIMAAQKTQNLYLMSNSSHLCIHVEVWVITKDTCTLDTSAHALKCPTNERVNKGSMCS